MGTRCHSDVRLRGHVGIRDNPDVVHSGTADHERGIGRGKPQPATSQLASTALPGLTSTAAVTDPLNALGDLIDVVLFLPNVAQAGLTPLNTTGLFTDLSFDDDELRDEALEGTEDQIAATLKIPGTGPSARRCHPGTPGWRQRWVARRSHR